MTTRVQNANMS